MNENKHTTQDKHLQQTNEVVRELKQFQSDWQTLWTWHSRRILYAIHSFQSYHLQLIECNLYEFIQI